MKKSVDMFASPLPGIIHRFSVQQKIKLMGSNSFQGLHYPSDIDIVSEITEPAKALANHLQKLFSGKLPFYFFDFKCGHNPFVKDKKLRWKPKDLANGKILLKNGYKSLEDCIKEDYLIKLDFVVPVGNTFAEVSEIFDTQYQSQKKKEQIEEELEEDIVQYTKKENSMKALKRLYALLLLDKKKPPKKLTTFFNSEYGLINKVANDLELMIELKKRYPVNLFNAIQNSKQQLALAKVPADLILSLDRKNPPLQKIVDKIRAIINPNAKQLLSSIYSKKI
jgi:hypothetical protein